MDFDIPDWLTPGNDILVAPCVEQFKAAAKAVVNCVCPEIPPPTQCFTVQDCITHSNISLYLMAGHVLVILGSMVFLHYLEHKESARRPVTNPLRYAAPLS